MSRLALLAAARLSQRTEREQRDANQVTTHYNELWMYRDGRLVKVKWRT